MPAAGRQRWLWGEHGALGTSRTTTRSFGKQRTRMSALLAGICLATSVWSTGCSMIKGPAACRIANPHLGSMTVAVAPALNLSGSTDFDPSRLADLMASELSYADGIAVVPVSRVLAVLAAQGAGGIESPEHALELVDLLGVDAILVFSVTEYDPYDPPSVGLAAQLFGRLPTPRGSLDPHAMERHATLAASPVTFRPDWLLGEAEQVFDASHDAVARDIRRFASQRTADDSPYGWRKYVVSQQHYMRYCCHAMIRELLGYDLGIGYAAAELRREG